MDIYDRIREEHRVLRALAEAIGESSRSSRSRSVLFERLQLELRVHGRAKEAVFYARLKRNGEVSGRLERMVEEHRNLERLLAALDVPSKQGEAWMTLFEGVRRMLEHHVRDEEREVFALARRAIAPTEAVALEREMVRGRTAFERVLSNDASPDERRSFVCRL